MAAWLAGIIINLLTIPDYYDVALRDFGLLVAALALSRLAVAHSAGTRSDGPAMSVDNDAHRRTSGSGPSGSAVLERRPGFRTWHLRNRP